MRVNADVSERLPTAGTNTSDFSAVGTVASSFYSLLDAVDSESIAVEFRIGIHSKKHDFDNNLKVGIFEGADPSDSLPELAEKTATHEQLSYMAGSALSR